MESRRRVVSVRPGQCFKGMAMIRKGQVRKVGGREMRPQATFVAELLQVAA